MAWRRTAALAALATVSGGCAVPRAQTRLDPQAAPSAVERDAAERLARARCDRRWSLAFPGLGQLCYGQDGEAAALLSLGALEAGSAAFAAARPRDGAWYEEPRLVVPLVAFTDLWVYGAIDTLLDEQRALRLTHVPQESLAELAVAPFDPTVLAAPSVWLGVLGTVGAAAGFVALTDEGFRRGRTDSGLRWLGEELSPEVGYPVATGSAALLFTQVAIAEEVAFRGLLQSSLTREHGAPTGLWTTVALFGLLHAPNALLLPEGQRLRYLYRELPFVTAVGAYLSLAYQWNDYRLAAPVAIHFWYDLLVTLLSYWRTGEAFPWSTSLTIPW